MPLCPLRQVHLCVSNFPVLLVSCPRLTKPCAPARKLVCIHISACFSPHTKQTTKCTSCISVHWEGCPHSVLGSQYWTDYNVTTVHFLLPPIHWSNLPVNQTQEFSSSTHGSSEGCCEVTCMSWGKDTSATKVTLSRPAWAWPLWTIFIIQWIVAAPYASVVMMISRPW